jgi:DNA polymerase elongation subunit (family B)
MFYTNVSVNYNGTINYRGVDVNGDRVTFQDTNFKPTLYANSGNNSVIDDKTFKTLDNTIVNPITFGSIADAKEHMDTYKGVDGYDLYGMTKWEYQYLGDKFKGKVDWDFYKLKICILDIEVDSSNGFPTPDRAASPVTSIAIKDLHSGEYNIWGYGDYETDNSKVNYIQVDTEEEMFVSFLDYWSNNYPDIITGWNTTFFDIPYIIRRALALGMEREIKKISPWGNYWMKKVSLGSRVDTKYTISGIDNLDYLEVYKKFTYNEKENYRLEFISNLELGYGKTDGGHHTGFTLWKTDHQKFIDYNIGDVDLISGLDNKLKMLKLICTMAYSAKCNFSDVLSQVRTWDCMIYNYLHERKITIPFVKSVQKGSSYAGAYVKEVNPRAYENIVSFDIASLYPNIIRTLNIGPETKVKQINVINVKYILNKKELNTENGSTATNGVVYSRDKQSLFSQLVEITYESRVIKRNEMMRLKKLDEVKYKQQIEDLDMEQYALKIQLNSLYGAIGNEYFRFYDRDNAEAITLTGQSIIQWVESSVNKALDHPEFGKMGEVFYCDTDSIFVELKPFINKFPNGNIIDKLDKLCKEYLEPKIKQSFDEYCEYVGAYKNHLVMKREAISNKGIWLAKKRYMLSISDNEGVRYEDPQVKIMGFDTAKSSTPQVSRDGLTKAIKLMLETNKETFGLEIKKFIDDFESKSLEDMFLPRSANNIRPYTNKLINDNEDKKKISRNLDNNEIDYFELKGPIHVRASIIHNMLLEKFKLQNKYETIKDGDKIKYGFLKPNIITGQFFKGDEEQEQVIAFKEMLPPEFGLHKYNDIEKNRRKQYDEPLQKVCDVIGWYSMFEWDDRPKGRLF